MLLNTFKHVTFPYGTCPFIATLSDGPRTNDQNDDIPKCRVQLFQGFLTFLLVFYKKNESIDLQFLKVYVTQFKLCPASLFDGRTVGIGN